MTHFRDTGLPKEGRRGSFEFDVQYFLAHEPGVRALHPDYQGAAEMYQQYKFEGRAGSSEFDVAFYLCGNRDLTNAFGPQNYFSASVHWVQFGLKEGRRTSSGFDLGYYLSHHSDLVNAFGANNYFAAREHWFNSGSRENRSSSPDDGRYVLRWCDAGCENAPVNRTSFTWINRQGPSSNAEFTHSTAPSCRSFLVKVNEFRSDMAHLSVNAKGNCQYTTIEMQASKWTSNGSGGGQWVRAGTLRSTAANAAKIGATFTDSSSGCSVELDLDGRNAPFLVKGDSYLFAIKPYAMLGTGLQYLEVNQPFQPFTLWSNQHAGISTMPATDADAASSGIDRWSTWISSGVGSRTDGMQSEPVYGLEPINSPGYSRPDFTTFALPIQGKVRSFVAEGTKEYGKPALAFSVSAGKQSGTGEPVIQLRFGTESPVYVYLKSSNGNGFLSIRKADGTGPTAADLQYITSALRSFTASANRASAPYSCEAEALAFARDAGLVTLTILATVAWPPAATFAAGFYVGFSFGATITSAVLSGIDAYNCLDNESDDQPSLEPKPDTKPNPLPPDPTPPPNPNPLGKQIKSITRSMITSGWINPEACSCDTAQWPAATCAPALLGAPPTYTELCQWKTIEYTDGTWVQVPP